MNNVRAPNPVVHQILQELVDEGLAEQFVGPAGERRWRLTAAGIRHAEEQRRSQGDQ